MVLGARGHRMPGVVKLVVTKLPVLVPGVGSTGATATTPLR